MHGPQLHRLLASARQRLPVRGRARLTGPWWHFRCFAPVKLILREGLTAISSLNYYRHTEKLPKCGNNEPPLQETRNGEIHDGPGFSCAFVSGRSSHGGCARARAGVSGARNQCDRAAARRLRGRWCSPYRPSSAGKGSRQTPGDREHRWRRPSAGHVAGCQAAG